MHQAASVPRQREANPQSFTIHTWARRSFSIHLRPVSPKAHEFFNKTQLRPSSARCTYSGANEKFRGRRIAQLCKTIPGTRVGGRTFRTTNATLPATLKVIDHIIYPYYCERAAAAPAAHCEPANGSQAHGENGKADRKESEARKLWTESRGWMNERRGLVGGERRSIFFLPRVRLSATCLGVARLVVGIRIDICLSFVEVEKANGLHGIACSLCISLLWRWN